MVKLSVYAIIISLMLVSCTHSQAGIPPYIQHMQAAMDTMTFEDAKTYLAETSREMLSSRTKGFAITVGSNQNKYEEKDWGTEENPTQLPALDEERFNQWKDQLHLICFYQDRSHYGDLRILVDLPYEQIFYTSDFSRYIKAKAIIDTIYHEGQDPESCSMTPSEIELLRRDIGWVDSLSMTLTITYPVNVKTYKLPAAEKELRLNNGSIKINKLKHNHALAGITGTLGDCLVDMQLTGNSGNNINTHFTAARRPADPEIYKEYINNYLKFNEAMYGPGEGNYSHLWEDVLDKKYTDKQQLMAALEEAGKVQADVPDFGDLHLYIIGEGNIKDLIFYIAHAYRSQTIRLVIPNRSDEL